MQGIPVSINIHILANSYTIVIILVLQLSCDVMVVTTALLALFVQ